MNIEIDEDRFYDAVTEGVRSAILIAIHDGLANGSKPADLIYQAIKDGASKAIEKEI